MGLRAAARFAGSVVTARFHGFADSPVAIRRHPSGVFVLLIYDVPTGSRTHPWLYAVTLRGLYS